MTVRARLRRAYERAAREVEVYRCVQKHPGTPRAARWCLALAIAYLLTPIDLVPDFIPVLGHLDDLIIVPALLAVAHRIVPREVWEECGGRR